MVEVATKRLFDLRRPEYGNPHWWLAIRKAVDSVVRKRNQKLRELNVTASMASLMQLLIESVRYPLTGPKAQSIDDAFIDRFNRVQANFDSDLDSIRVALGGKSAIPEGGPPTEKDVKREAAQRSFSMWESIFGKRGTPETERKVQQTTDILMHKIDEAEAAKKAQKRKPAKRKPTRIRTV